LVSVCEQSALFIDCTWDSVAMAGDARSALQLKAKEVESIRSKMKVEARRRCEHLASTFADCCRGRTLSVIWVCRPQMKELNECLKEHTNDAVLEEYKRDYVREREAEGKHSPKQ